MLLPHHRKEFPQGERFFAGAQNDKKVRLGEEFFLDGYNFILPSHPLTRELSRSESLVEYGKLGIMKAIDTMLDL